MKLRLLPLLFALLPLASFAAGTMPVKDANGATVTIPKPAAQGTAGTPSADVLTVQGASGMVPLAVDASATTQPISGNVAVTNLPSTQTVAGAVAITNLPTTQAVTGTVAIGNFPSTQTVAGTVGISGTVPVSGPLTDAQMRATAVPVSGTFWQATQPVSGTFWQATQPVSGSVAVTNLPSTQAVSGTVGISGTIPVSGPLTDAQMRATAVPVSGTFWQATQPISGSVSVTNFPATQPVSGTFWPTTQPVSADALPLPTGAATETTLAALSAKIPASPATEGGNLATIVSRTPSLGSAASASSSPVVIASDQAALPTKPALLTGTASISANATSGASLTLTGHGTATLQLSGTFTATVQFQITGDGTNWLNVTGSNSIVNAATGAYLASGNMTAVGIFQLDLTGMQGVRIITTAYTSGTVVATLTAAPGNSVIGVEGVPPVSQSGTWTVQPGNTANTTAWLMTMATPTLSAVNSAATTNATSIKASAGTVFSITCSNTNAAARYVKIYNKASAPTVGTDVPVITLTVPATNTVTFTFATQGVRLGTGIALAITGAMADSDTTAVAANEVKVLTSYL